MSKTRVAPTCMGLTREGRPCRRRAMRDAPWCSLHLNAPVPCVGGPWDGDEAYGGDGLRVAWAWHLFATSTPLFFSASMAKLEDLARIAPGDLPVGTYRLVRQSDAFTYVWERAPCAPAASPAPGDVAPPAAPEGR